MLSLLRLESQQKYLDHIGYVGNLAQYPTRVNSVTFIRAVVVQRCIFLLAFGVF